MIRELTSAALQVTLTHSLGTTDLTLLLWSIWSYLLSSPPTAVECNSLLQYCCELSYILIPLADSDICASADKLKPT